MLAPDDDGDGRCRVPDEAFSVAHTPVVAHDSELGSIEDAGHHVEVAREPEGVADEHLLGYIESRDVDGVIACEGGEEFVGVLEVVFSEADAAVESVDPDDFEHRAGDRGGGPWGEAYKPVRRDEDFCGEVVGDWPDCRGLFCLEDSRVRNLHQ